MICPGYAGHYSPIIMESVYPLVPWIAVGFSFGVVSMLSVNKMPAVLRFVKYSTSVVKGNTKPKLVIVARSNFAMGRGKIASQCAHAAVCCYKEASMKNPEIVHIWELLGQPKIVLRVDDTDENILNLAEKARNLGLVTNVIRDAGKTQIAAGSITVVGIGPGNSDAIDTVTGHLKLL